MKNSFEINPKKQAEQKDGQEIELSDIAIGQEIKIKTKNTTYVLEHRKDGFYISGHAEICPTPIKVSVSGSTWSGSALFRGIAEGVHFEFGIPGKRSITTSEIQKIETGATSFSA